MVKTIASLLAAIGTITVAVMAIWGNSIRSVLAPVLLTLTVHTPEGDPVLFDGGVRAMFYHLKVLNKRSWMSAENCHVLLIGLSRRDPSGLFQPVPMSFPVQFVWTPLEFSAPSITLINEHILDLGYVQENGGRFIPRLYSTPNNFRGYVAPNEVVRFQIRIEANAFVSPVYVVEVAWDGSWSFTPDEMKGHLIVRMIEKS